jgi:hypothetical protein
VRDYRGSDALMNESSSRNARPVSRDEKDGIVDPSDGSAQSCFIRVVCDDLIGKSQEVQRIELSVLHHQ